MSPPTQLNTAAARTTRAASSTPAALPIDGPRITNIVCGVNLNCRIDLKTIALYARNAAYAPKRFQAVILRRLDPRATALVFQSGKMQVLGAKSVMDARLSARKFARMIQKLGFNVKMSDFNVQNIVAHADIKCAVRLEGLHAKHYLWTRFEPELFPGLVYRIEQPDLRVSCLIFANGKMVVLGAKREEHIDQAIGLLYPVLKQFPVRQNDARDTV